MKHRMMPYFLNANVLGGLYIDSKPGLYTERHEVRQTAQILRGLRHNTLGSLASHLVGLGHELTTPAQERSDRAGV